MRRLQPGAARVEPRGPSRLEEPVRLVPSLAPFAEFSCGQGWASGAPFAAALVLLQFHFELSREVVLRISSSFWEGTFTFEQLRFGSCLQSQILPLPWSLVVAWVCLSTSSAPPFLSAADTASLFPGHKVIRPAALLSAYCKERERDTSVAEGCPPLHNLRLFGSLRRFTFSDADGLALPNHVPVCKERARDTSVAVGCPPLHRFRGPEFRVSFIWRLLSSTPSNCRGLISAPPVISFEECLRGSAEVAVSRSRPWPTQRPPSPDSLAYYGLVPRLPFHSCKERARDTSVAVGCPPLLAHGLIDLGTRLCPCRASPPLLLLVRCGLVPIQLTFCKEYARDASGVEPRQLSPLSLLVRCGLVPTPPIPSCKERARDTSVAVGCPPLLRLGTMLSWPGQSPYLSSQPHAIPGGRGVILALPATCQDRVRDISVSDGCLPLPFACMPWGGSSSGSLAALLLGWLASLVVPFSVHLLLLVLGALSGLLIRPLRANATPLGDVLLLPSRGLPLGFLCPFAVCSVAQYDALQRLGSSLVLNQSRQTRVGRTPGSVTSCVKGWAWVFTCFALPSQLWAAPEGWSGAVSEMHRIAQSLPDPLDSEPLPPPVSSPSGDFVTTTCSAMPTDQAPSADVAGSSLSSSGEDSRIGMLRQAQDYFFQRPLENAVDIPAPPLPRASALPSAPGLEGVCYALAPGYQSEVLRLALRPPLDLATFDNAARDALQHLRLPYCFIIAPTVPQLGPDFASIVVVPKWLPQAGRQVVIFDFRALEGPVYASFTFENISHQECVQEAVFQGFRQCHIYVQGHSRALLEGDTFLATLGCVIQFQPIGQAAEWHCTLATRFDRPQWWASHPQLPAIGIERPVFVTHHDRHTLYSAARFPGIPTLQYLAGLVDRPPQRTLFVSPPGRGLTNIDSRGVSCRDALSVFPLTPCRDREGVLVFLDARQAGKEVTHFYLGSTSVDPLELVRYLGLRPPPCYRFAIDPRPGRSGLLHLSEGDVVVFGYKEDHPWSTDEESSSGGEGGESETQHSSDVPEIGEELHETSRLPRGPPPPVPVNHPAEPVNGRSRSRSPAAASSGLLQAPTGVSTSRRAPAGSGCSFASTALGAALGLAQLDQVDGALLRDDFALRLAQPHTAYPPVAWRFGVSEVFLRGLQCLFCGLVMWHCLPVLCQFYREVLLRLNRAALWAPLPWFAGYRPMHAKLWTEPTTWGPADFVVLRNLRRAALTLGGRWPRLTADGLAIDELQTDSSESADDSTWVQWVAVVVLAPSYLPEQLTVALQFPTTLASALPPVNAARAPEALGRFPVLREAHPQPLPGAAVFVAMPPWESVKALCCLDLMRVDGRLFSLELPPYVTRAYLLHRVSLSADAPVTVYVGAAPVELALEASVHLSSGDTVRFLPESVVPRDLPLLAHLLVGLGDWLEHVQLPEVIGPPAFCLVRYDEATIFHSDRSRPTQYRHQIAQLVGAPLSELVLQPACPRAADAAIDGYPCLSVIAVACAPASEDPVLVLLDCRSILQGWIAVAVPTGFLRIHEVLARLSVVAPPGHELCLQEAPWDVVHSRVTPGSVPSCCRSCTATGTVACASHFCCSRSCGIQCCGRAAYAETRYAPVSVFHARTGLFTGCSGCSS